MDVSFGVLSSANTGLRDGLGDLLRRRLHRGRRPEHACLGPLTLFGRVGVSGLGVEGWMQACARRGMSRLLATQHQRNSQ